MVSPTPATDTRTKHATRQSKSKLPYNVRLYIFVYYVYNVQHSMTEWHWLFFERVVHAVSVIFIWMMTMMALKMTLVWFDAFDMVRFFFIRFIRVPFGLVFLRFLFVCVFGSECILLMRCVSIEIIVLIADRLIVWSFVRWVELIALRSGKLNLTVI